MSDVINVPDVGSTQEEMNKPQLDVGQYLAVVVAVAPKENPVKQSYGLNWSLLINSDPKSIVDGWNSEARAISQDYYTYIGKKNPITGVVEKAEKVFNLAAMLGAFGSQGGSIDPANFILRQVIVNVIHEPSMEDQEALKANPEHVIERFFAKVNRVKPYRKGETLAPRLDILADAIPTHPSATSEADAGGEF